MDELGDLIGEILGSNGSVAGKVFAIILIVAIAAGIYYLSQSACNNMQCPTGTTVTSIEGSCYCTAKPKE